MGYKNSFSMNFIYNNINIYGIINNYIIQVYELYIINMKTLRYVFRIFSYLYKQYVGKI